MPAVDPTLIAAVAVRYAAAGRFVQGFVRGKLRHDPASAALLRPGEGGLGHVLDIGCGHGQLGIALLLSGRAQGLTGLDRAEAKIASAQAAAIGLPACFIAGDLIGAALPDCDTALLIDVLYQLPEPMQMSLLRSVVHSARRRVCIRALDPDRGWRSAVARGMERAGRAFRPDGARAAIAPLPVRSIAEPFIAAGFTLTISPCWGRMPLANVLLVAERCGR